MSREDEIAELADTLNISYGETERRYTKAENKEFNKVLKKVVEKHAPRIPQNYTPRPKMLTKKQFEKKCKDIGKDTLVDNPEMEMQDVASDLADCMLYDNDVLLFAQKEFRTTDRQSLKEIVADYIAG